MIRRGRIPIAILKPDFTICRYHQSEADVLPAAQLKFADIHCLLREELASVLRVLLPQRWTEIIRQFQQETQATKSRRKHSTLGRKTNAKRAAGVSQRGSSGPSSHH